MPEKTHHLVVYPGSFDPMTLGHLDVVSRGRQLFDEIVVAVGFNPGKSQLFTPDERVEIAQLCINEMCASTPGAPVRVCAYRGLTVDFARSVGANAILKGVRNLSDLQNEVQQALTNRQVAGLETAFVVSGQSFAYTSSSLIKQITALGEDLSVLQTMVPNLVLDRLRAKKAEHHPLIEAIRASARGEEQD
ncbi:MAG: pantetheine-phosphate adenylyltransferase [Phycisphaeraceae bacterium]|nr:pantetheine-phosphate adenylyltransferase [Phycisphaerales bacterium]MCB9859751.1 pantetheine-phosphate adenylyltransferase [Phycisphaeraceae bacterium]